MHSQYWDFPNKMLGTSCGEKIDKIIELNNKQMRTIEKDFSNLSPDK